VSKLAELRRVVQGRLGEYRIPGRNAVLLPSVRGVAEKSGTWDGSHFSFDRQLAQALQEAAGVKQVDLEAGRSVAPLWLHGQRAPRGMQDVPTALRNATKNQGPLYFTDNPLIATTTEYASHSPYDEAQRFLWPFLLEEGAVPTVRKTKGEWRSGIDRLDKQLEGYGQGSLTWDAMIHALQAAECADPGSVPPNLIFQGIRDVGPGTKGTGFEMSTQNQMMLRSPLELLRQQKLRPVFDDATPYKCGGLAQVRRAAQ
jgi:hypothetical protein